MDYREEEMKTFDGTQEGLRKGKMRFSDRHPVLFRTLLVLGCTVVPLVVIGWFPIILLLVYAEKIKGVLFVILLALYVLILGTAAVLVMRPARMRQLRAILGDEAFFARYPREKKKEERRWQKVVAYRKWNEKNEMEFERDTTENM